MDDGRRTMVAGWRAVAGGGDGGGEGGGGGQVLFLSLMLRISVVPQVSKPA
jgi:hypothetical protein